MANTAPAENGVQVVGSMVMSAVREPGAGAIKVVEYTVRPARSVDQGHTERSSATAVMENERIADASRDDGHDAPRERTINQQRPVGSKPVAIQSKPLVPTANMVNGSRDKPDRLSPCIPSAPTRPSAAAVVQSGTQPVDSRTNLNHPVRPAEVDSARLDALAEACARDVDMAMEARATAAQAAIEPAANPPSAATPASNTNIAEVPQLPVEMGVQTKAMDKVVDANRSLVAQSSSAPGNSADSQDVRQEPAPGFTPVQYSRHHASASDGSESESESEGSSSSGAPHNHLPPPTFTNPFAPRQGQAHNPPGNGYTPANSGTSSAEYAMARQQRNVSFWRKPSDTNEIIDGMFVNAVPETFTHKEREKARKEQEKREGRLVKPPTKKQRAAEKKNKEPSFTFSLDKRSGVDPLPSGALITSGNGGSLVPIEEFETPSPPPTDDMDSLQVMVAPAQQIDFQAEMPGSDTGTWQPRSVYQRRFTSGGSILTAWQRNDGDPSERPYACREPGCMYRAKKSHQLRNHEERHREDRPATSSKWRHDKAGKPSIPGVAKPVPQWKYVCPHCTRFRGFQEEDQLKTHVTRAHSQPHMLGEHVFALKDSPAAWHNYGLGQNSDEDDEDDEDDGRWNEHEEAGVTEDGAVRLGPAPGSRAKGKPPRKDSQDTPPMSDDEMHESPGEGVADDAAFARRFSESDTQVKQIVGPPLRRRSELPVMLAQPTARHGGMAFLDAQRAQTQTPLPPLRPVTSFSMGKVGAGNVDWSRSAPSPGPSPSPMLRRDDGWSPSVGPYDKMPGADWNESGQRLDWRAQYGRGPPPPPPGPPVPAPPRFGGMQPPSRVEAVGSYAGKSPLDGRRPVPPFPQQQYERRTSLPGPPAFDGRVQPFEGRPIPPGFGRRPTPPAFDARPQPSPRPPPPPFERGRPPPPPSPAPEGRPQLPSFDRAFEGVQTPASPYTRPPLPPAPPSPTAPPRKTFILPVARVIRAENAPVPPIPEPSSRLNEYSRKNRTPVNGYGNGRRGEDMDIDLDIVESDMVRAPVRHAMPSPISRLPDIEMPPPSSKILLQRRESEPAIRRNDLAVAGEPAARRGSEGVWTDERTQTHVGMKRPRSPEDDRVGRRDSPGSSRLRSPSPRRRDSVDRRLPRLEDLALPSFAREQGYRSRMGEDGRVLDRLDKSFLSSRGHRA
ncbi:hypothetical protein CYLTODRAFT_443808 [Cylindrobasidium torrendii FP15055 ss-10]|uniref:C2H2-type domain-containing protein n=1 Tax=Cylindrobasidium torrendii FP15055 ss-10 TaxID=1314674 RepID=A0A0D7BC24_9AGAR|nr:hypothetical protein CYLTODRAFT_443808 [Cylindrobasidium torrendii FP15055 ss-10]